MTYQQNDDTESATGRRIEITREMVAAGERELVFDSELIRSAVVFDILAAALEAGGYQVIDAGVGL